jgi:hypothetical protein
VATTVQWASIAAFMKLAQVTVMGRVPALAAKAAVAAFFAFMALRSRVFSPLDNSRPSEASEKIRRQVALALAPAPPLPMAHALLPAPHLMPLRVSTA